MSQTSTTIPCPGCGKELPNDDTRAQKAHMEEHHPEIIAERLENAGFQLKDGKWVDTLAASD